MALGAAALAGGGFVLSRFIDRDAREVRSTLVAPEKPVVMRTKGGLLEVATVRALERFTREDSRDFWGIDLGTTVSQIQVPVTYRFHIEMAREWPIELRGRTAIARAPAIKPSLPVAFDTTAMEKYTRAGWARFNKEENLEALERSMTSTLAERAAGDAYRGLAEDAARRTIAEFVTTWLLKETDWKRDPLHKVVVLFPGEKPPPLP
ncbi:MAG: hypothetical protein EBS39_02200 [Gammaproteobacteria bacterium]|nr:hypothetical protein [Gammaproteobacteria bacterium]